MQNLFLTSNIGGIIKENGEKKAINFSNQNNFLENIKSCMNSHKKFVLVASDPYAYENNDKYLDLDIQALQLSGLKFEENIVLDYRLTNNLDTVFHDASLVFLSGGNTYKQNLFFNDINLSEYLLKKDCCIVGISAGSINSADIVFNSPEKEDDLTNPQILEGLGLTSINIEPHFLVENENSIQKNAIISESYNRVLYGLSDGSYIFNNRIYGICYKIWQGFTTKICDESNIYDIRF